MSDDEAHIYEFLLSMRGTPFSAKEVSKALDLQRADRDPRWAHTPLKKLLLKERIQQTNEGFYIIPLQMEEEDEEEVVEALVFVPGDVWCGSGLAGLVPLIAVDIFNLKASETMFLSKAQALGGSARASQEAKPVFTAFPPAEAPRPEEPPRTEPPPAAVPDEAAEVNPHKRKNPFDGIEFFGVPRRPPRP